MQLGRGRHQPAHGFGFKLSSKPEVVKKSSLFCPLWAKAQLVTAVLATSLGKQAYFATRARTSRGQSNWATRATHSVAQLDWPLDVRVTRWRNTPCNPITHTTSKSNLNPP